ncbi:heavy metal translocating P-type ATPase [Cohnella lubricantis]|uniref:P-type Cu(+) transporter n=1 Tax=Cohnella lubricantis TaxID=2163172 RepID=A0A841TD22_9BACL|nr:cation-translocating P-type ATPase [Cohnella lubricantis]MBB6677899.1 cation-translocating P-type ATPase [Cohnella lubricantis]MBP2119082.1 Cu+-exporting ATPase [Cohnella lubricantis]
MTKTLQLQIEGMTCAACSARIERAVSRMPGIQEVSVSLPLGQASVKLDNRLIGPEQIKRRIDELGYSAKEELEDVRTFNRGEIRTYRNRLLIAAILSFPLLWSMLGHFEFASGLPIPPLFESPWFQLAVATILQLYVAYPFYYGAYQAIRQRSANMDVLVALGTSISYLYSHWLLFASLKEGGFAHVHPHQSHLYFDTSAMILTSVLFGKLLESIAKGQALKEMGSLQSLQSSLIRIDGPEGEEWVAPDRLRQGDTAVVHPGELVSVDGRVIAGRTEVDESFLTGESRLVSKAVGDVVYTGSRNLGGVIRVKTGAAASGTRLAGMIKLVEDAQHAKPVIQRNVDRVAAIAIPVMIACAAMTYAVWLWMLGAGEADVALHNAMAVLLVSCPCALGLAAPISILIASSLSAKRGVLFKEGRSIERLYKVDCIVLDKTGTLTEGKPSLAAIDSPAYPDSYVLRLAAALERHSAHPVAQAIVTEANKRRLLIPQAEQVRETAGQGITGIVEGRVLALGSAAWLRSLGVRLPAQGAEAGGASAPNLAVSASALHLSADGQWIASLTWADRLRPGTAAAIRQLSAHGEVLMATGDDEAAAKRVAREAGIGRYYAKMLPEHKLAVVRRLQTEGRTVAMVGDGVNDAAALAAADVGLVMDSGTAAAIEAGDVILLKGELARAALSITISKRTMRNIKQNLGLSLAYNGVMIPLAAVGWLDPRVACLAMALSSVFVVGNSLRLTRQLRRERVPDAAVS